MKLFLKRAKRIVQIYENWTAAHWVEMAKSIS